MRVLTNDALIQQRRSIAQFSFFAAIAGLIFSFLIATRLSDEDSSVGFYFNCVVIPLLFAIVIFSVRMANNWVREPVPWKALQEALRGATANMSLYHFIMPARHVLVSPNGVFVLFPLFQDRPIVVRDDKWSMPGGFIASIFAFMRQENVGNPTLEAQVEAQQVQKFLDKELDGHAIEVYPVIVFIHPSPKVVLEGEQTIPVVFANSKLKGYTSLKEFVKSQKEAKHVTLTEEQLEQLDDTLLYE